MKCRGNPVVLYKKMTIKLHVAWFEHFGQAYIFLHKMIFIYCYSNKGIPQYCVVLKKNVPYKV